MPPLIYTYIIVLSNDQSRLIASKIKVFVYILSVCIVYIYYLNTHTCAAGTGELQFIEGTMNANIYCDILKQSTITSLRRLGRKVVFQHDNDSKHTSQTHLQDDHCLAKEAEGKGNMWVSRIHQLRDVVMEEWKRTPVATCEALVNSMPKRVKAVLENNGGHTKY